SIRSMDATQQPFDEEAVVEEMSDESSLKSETSDEETFTQQAPNEANHRIPHNLPRRLPPANPSCFWTFVPLVLLPLIVILISIGYSFHTSPPSPPYPLPPSPPPISTSQQQPQPQQQQGDTLDHYHSRQRAGNGERGPEMITAVVIEEGQMLVERVVQQGGVTYSDDMVVGNMTTEEVVEKGRIGSVKLQRGVDVQ
ncbi:MAG: hypothetical protein Q9168_005502, partial [Polycauliona sp. 1 TL-2023]